jgi:hypothetical protein
LSNKYALSFDYEFDFLLVGIHSFYEPHQLVYQLNLNLNLNLKREFEDFAFPLKNEFLKVPWFKYHDEYLRINYHLFSNRSDGVSFIKELSAFDYLLKLEENYFEVQPDIVKNIKKIHGVLLAKNIDLALIRKPELLITE